MKATTRKRLNGILIAMAIAMMGIHQASADLLVGSGDNPHSVLRYDENTGVFLGTLVPGGSGGLAFTTGLAFGPDGNLYVGLGGGNGVNRYDATTGAFIDAFASDPSLLNIRGIAFGPDGNLYVAGTTSDNIVRFNGSSGALIDTVITAGDGLDEPIGLEFGSDGNLYVASRGNNRILRFDGTVIDVFVPAFSGGLDAPGGLTFGPDGNLYVANQTQNNVLRYNGSSGMFIDEFVTTAGSGGINVTFGLVFGPDENLYVTSGGDNRVFRYDGSTGMFIDEFVSPPDTGGLNQPRFLIFTPAPTLDALIDVDPDTINRKSLGQWVTAYITLPDGFDVADIDVTTIKITSLIGASCDPNYSQLADLSFTPVVGDRDEDLIPDLTVKFNRQYLIPNLCLDDVGIVIEGDLAPPGGEHFSGADFIRVIDRGKP